MPSHPLDHEVPGASAQRVALVLGPGATLIAEANCKAREATRAGDR